MIRYTKIILLVLFFFSATSEAGSGAINLGPVENKTGNQNASRANFFDVTDFIGWYTTQSENMIGISKKDYYNQYLAYHEGQNGWSKETFKNKEWLIEVAKNVERNTNMFNKQLKSCEDKLNKKGLFGLF